ERIWMEICGNDLMAYLIGKDLEAYVSGNDLTGTSIVRKGSWRHICQNDSDGYICQGKGSEACAVETSDGIPSGKRS
ncbi:hypothetical protein AVEN_175141-1, partial [Araneus ventricosus]